MASLEDRFLDLLEDAKGEVEDSGKTTAEIRLVAARHAARLLDVANG